MPDVDHQQSQSQHYSPPARPAHSEDAEQAVLSAWLMDGRAIDEVRAILSPAGFYISRHRIIAGAALMLRDRGTTVDPLTLSDELARRGELDAAGGMEYIGYLIDAAPHADNVRHHAEIVRRFAAQRTLVAQLEQAVKLASAGGESPAEIAQALVAKLLPLAVPRAGEGFVLAKDDLYALLEKIEQRATNPGLIGVPTGYSEIDDWTGGWRGGELISLCAVPKAGKTLLLVNCALNNALAGIGVGFVSAEMGRAELLERMLANMTTLDSRDLRNGRVNAKEMGQLGKAAARLARANLHIDETAGPKLTEIVAKARALKIRHPEIRVLYVDYLQLLHADEETRAEEIRLISNGLAGLGKELDVATVATGQLNDKVVEAREDKRPRLSDIQGSSGIRQASHAVGLIYRPGMYEPRPLDSMYIDFAATRALGVFSATLELDPKHMRVLSPRNPNPVSRQQELINE